MQKRQRIASRQFAIVLAAVFAFGTGAGAVLAYWTAGGAGSATGSVGSLLDLTVNQATTLTAMYPGDQPQALSGDFDNPNDGDVFVTTVTVSIASVTKAVGAAAGTCDATDFTITDATATVNDQVPTGTGVGSWSGPTIQFHNKVATNQDACKGATVHLGYSIP